MTIDEALQAMSCLDGQQDGTSDRAALVEKLYRKLLEDPETFWEEFFSRLDAVQPNSARNLAMKLLISGEVTSETTFEEAEKLLANYYRPANKQ